MSCIKKYFWFIKLRSADIISVISKGTFSTSTFYFTLSRSTLSPLWNNSRQWSRKYFTSSCFHWVLLFWNIFQNCIFLCISTSVQKREASMILEAQIKLYNKSQNKVWFDGLSLQSQRVINHWHRPISVNWWVSENRPALIWNRFSPPTQLVNCCKYKICWMINDKCFEKT